MTQVLDQPTTPPRGNASPRRGVDPDGFLEAGFVQWLVAALLLGSAAVHFALAAPHFGEATALGAGFLLAGWAQVALAVGALLRPSRPVLTAIIVVSGACIAAWALSRTVGLPFGADGGHSEEVTIVDGVTVAMEAVTMALAAMLFSRAVREYRANTPALVVTIGILGLASAIVASPAAREHGADEHSDAAHIDAATSGLTHSHPASGDQQLAGSTSALNGQSASGSTADSHDIAAETAPDQPLDPVTRALLGEQLTAARAVALQFPTAASAMAVGYREVGGFGPGTGAHYVNGRLVGAGFDAGKPLTLLYDGTSPTSQIVGVMYYSTLPTAPEGFAGPNDHWHRHSNSCSRNGTLLSRPDSDITEAQCTGLGGTYAATTGWMVHAWVVPSWESPSGVFSHENPNLRCGDGTVDTDATGRCQGT